MDYDFDTWVYFLGLMLLTVWFGFVSAREFEGILEPLYERGEPLFLVGRALLLFGYLFYFAKMGPDGLIAGVSLAFVAGAYARFAV